MANTFKQATKSSLVTDAVTSTNTNILVAGASSTVIILNALVANKTSTSANVDVYLVPNSGDNVYLLKSVPVSDVIRARCDTATAMDITLSYLDQT